LYDHGAYRDFADFRIYTEADSRRLSRQPHALVQLKMSALKGRPARSSTAQAAAFDSKWPLGVPVAAEQKVSFALVAVRDNRWLGDISMG
jgi:hypothetical protein